MFFERFALWLSDLLPKGKLRGHFFQMIDYIGCREKVIAWHQTELERLDPMFRLQQNSLRLMEAQTKATEAGVAPFDPKYPNYKDFERVARSGSRGSSEELLRLSRKYAKPKDVLP